MPIPSEPSIIEERGLQIPHRGLWSLPRSLRDDDGAAHEGASQWPEKAHQEQGREAHQHTLLRWAQCGEDAAVFGPARESHAGFTVDRERKAEVTARVPRQCHLHPRW